MRYLLNPETRAARIAVLRNRWDVIRFGDEIAEPFLASLATIYGVVLLLPGDTTAHATAWRVLARVFFGDVGLGVLFTVYAVALWLVALRLVGPRVCRTILLSTLSLWVAMAVGFAFGYLLSLGAYLSVLYAFLAWVAYIRSEPT